MLCITCKGPIYPRHADVEVKPLPDFFKKMENGSRSAVRVCQVFDDAFVDNNQNVFCAAPVHVATINLCVCLQRELGGKSAGLRL